MAAAAGAPPPGPPQPPPPPPPEESSDSEPEAEPGSPQKLIRKVSTSGQIRQKVSPRRRPGRAPLTPRQPCEARGPAGAAAQARPARPRVPLLGRSAPYEVTGRASGPAPGPSTPSLRAAAAAAATAGTPGRGRRWAPRGAGRPGRCAGTGCEEARAARTRWKRRPRGRGRTQQKRGLPTAPRF